MILATPLGVCFSLRYNETGMGVLTIAKSEEIKEYAYRCEGVVVLFLTIYCYCMLNKARNQTTSFTSIQKKGRFLNDYFFYRES